MNEKTFGRILGWLGGDDASIGGRYVRMVIIAAIFAVVAAVYLIGKDNLQAFFREFSTTMTGARVGSLALFVAVLILLTLYTIGGLVEVHAVPDKLKEYAPAPFPGAELVNVFIAVLLVVLAYTAITNILWYCVLYIVFTLLDLFFRSTQAHNVHRAMQRVLQRAWPPGAAGTSLPAGADPEHIVWREYYVFYCRYPHSILIAIRLALTFVALLAIVTDKYQPQLDLGNIAYVNLIYCIVINEVFAWTYRLRFVRTLRSVEY